MKKSIELLKEFLFFFFAGGIKTAWLIFICLIFAPLFMGVYFSLFEHLNLLDSLYYSVKVFLFLSDFTVYSFIGRLFIIFIRLSGMVFLGLIIFISGRSLRAAYKKIYPEEFKKDKDK